MSRSRRPLKYDTVTYEAGEAGEPQTRGGAGVGGVRVADGMGSGSVTAR